MKFSLYNGLLYQMFDAGTADKVLHLLTRQGKKQTVLAKGVRKQTSKKSAAIDALNHVQIKTVDGYSLPIATEIKLLHEQKAWKQDIRRMTSLQTFCEILAHFAAEDQAEPLLWKAAEAFLQTHESERHMLRLAVTIQTLLHIAGLLPPLHECMETGAELESEASFTHRASIGYVAEGIHGSRQRVPARLVKTQRYALTHSLAEVLRISLTTDEARQLLNIMLDWLEQTSERELKSRKVALRLL